MNSREIKKVLNIKGLQVYKRLNKIVIKGVSGQASNIYQSLRDYYSKEILGIVLIDTSIKLETEKVVIYNY